MVPGSIPGRSNTLISLTWHVYTVDVMDITTEVDPWCLIQYNAHFRDIRVILHGMIGNPTFKKGFDVAPLREYD